MVKKSHQQEIVIHGAYKEGVDIVIVAGRLMQYRARTKGLHWFNHRRVVVNALMFVHSSLNPAIPVDELHDSRDFDELILQRAVQRRRGLPISSARICNWFTTVAAYLTNHRRHRQVHAWATDPLQRPVTAYRCRQPERGTIRRRQTTALQRRIWH